MGISRVESRTKDASPGPCGLAEVIGQLSAQGEAEVQLEAARTLVESAKAHCGGAIDLGLLAAAAEALLAVIPLRSPSQGRDDAVTPLGPPLERGDGEHCRALGAVAHEFIDLARLEPVRQAAYPADDGSPGGEWLNRIIQLIERSDFTVGHMFRQRAAQYSEKTLFTVPRGELVTKYAWEQVAEETQKIACGVLGLLGDDPRVAIFSPNRLEGALFDLACLTNGIFNTMVADNSVDSQLMHILIESDAHLIVVSGTEQLQKALAAFENLPSLEWIVTLDELPTVLGARVISLGELIDRGKSVPAEKLDERLAQVRSNDLATTMYTSGTTGAPKGIKFTHLNLVSKRFARTAALPFLNEDEVFLCYLPLYHTFGRYLEMLAAVHLAATYVFAEDPSTETLVEHMRRFHPTAMISVPKKWLDLHRMIAATDEPPDDPDEVRKALGELTGGRLRWGLSAAGRLDPAIFRFFQYHGIDLLSGYGMTEATGGITMTPPGRYADDSIGLVLPAIELGFGEDNELLLRGPYVTPGYTDPQDDAASFRDGWFCTGDIVSRDKKGFLTHVDRKKDIYKNAGGRTIAPQRVEALFADFPEISRVFAVGDGRDFVTLLIRPNVDYPEPAFHRLSDASKREYFRGLVVSCNRFLAPFERIVNFAIIDRDFSAEHGELTPKGSFRRSAVEENFRDAIEPMYASSAIERVVDGIRIKVPIAFLQHLGATETGTVADKDGLEFRAADKKLRIRRDSDMADRVWIGNCCYDNADRVLDLDDWLRVPELWVGNAELTCISGESILQWSLSADDRAVRSKMVRLVPTDVPIDSWEKRIDAPTDATPSLMTVHAAAVALSGGDRDLALKAVDYLAHTITVGRARYQELAESHLQHASQHLDSTVRSRAFVSLLEHQPAESFGKTASLFCGSMLDFLDEEACVRIARVGVDSRRWQALRGAFAQLRRSVAHSGRTHGERFAVRLLRSLARIAALDEDLYLPVRQELSAWMLAPVSALIRETATDLIEELTTALRERLGTKQIEATDPKTGRTFTWGETLQFEDGIDADELTRIAGAMQHTELVREAVYLLHRKRRIDLNDLAPDSIWISLVGTRFGRSTYHVGVRLLSRERCDFTLHVRNTSLRETFVTDLALLCVAAGILDESPLTPQLGGYWRKYDIATVEHVSGEPVEALVQHMHEHPDKDIRQSIRGVWKHLSWSALSAAFEFWRRTEGRWMLTGAMTRDISVPFSDFEGEARVFSAVGWRAFHSPLDMILRLKHAFLDRVRFHYSALAAEANEDTLFAAAIEACGLREGLVFLSSAIAEVERIQSPSNETLELCDRIKAYVDSVNRNGYMPKSLYFAIQRYHTWSKQVPDAGVHARAAQLRELQRNYRMDDVARRFPGSRLWLYAETVLKGSPEEGRATIDQAIRRLRSGADIKEALGQLYTALREKLPSQDQQYFLTRAAYPHLDVDEKAQLITTLEVGPGRAELATTHTDRTQRQLTIRPVANSREVDILHRIFFTGGLGGAITQQEHLLVVVDQAGYVVGGAGYIRRTPNHVLLDKIAVLPRCRGRGIGQVLLYEFLRRIKAEGALIVSGEFIRASWLAQFGFKSHPRYAGVVLPLTEGTDFGSNL